MPNQPGCNLSCVHEKVLMVAKYLIFVRVWILHYPNDLNFKIVVGQNDLSNKWYPEWLQAQWRKRYWNFGCENTAYSIFVFRGICFPSFTFLTLLWFSKHFHLYCKHFSDNFFQLFPHPSPQCQDQDQGLFLHSSSIKYIQGPHNLYIAILSNLSLSTSSRNASL